MENIMNKTKVNTKRCNVKSATVFGPLDPSPLTVEDAVAYRGNIAYQGIQSRLIGILDVLDESSILSENIISELTGEGHEESNKKPIGPSVDERLVEILTRACNLRGSLQKILDSIEPHKLGKGQAKVARG